MSRELDVEIACRQRAEDDDIFSKFAQHANQYFDTSDERDRGYGLILRSRTKTAEGMAVGVGGVGSDSLNERLNFVLSNLELIRDQLAGFDVLLRIGVFVDGPMSTLQMSKELLERMTTFGIDMEFSCYFCSENDEL